VLKFIYRLSVDKLAIMHADAGRAIPAQIGHSNMGPSRVLESAPLQIGRGSRRPGKSGPKNRLLARWSPGKIGSLIAGIPLACAVAVWLDWHHDNAVLRRQAIEITANSTSDGARIHTINDWVYHHKGFGKNSGYFVVPALGPTPVQVLEQGGDCADKSRLVAAMLNELGIEAGLVMIASCLHCAFIHTVVEAGYEGGRMVVDPIWNVDYPSDNGGFLGVRDLAWTSLGEERVVELQRQRGAADKIAVMPATEAKFEYAVAVNWDKSVFTQTVAKIINVLGYSPDTIFRPRLLEDPKMALFWFLIIIAVGLAVASVIFRRIYNILMVSRHPDGRSSHGRGASPH
jgi:hypothetical protein